MKTDLEFLHKNTLKWLIHLLFSKDEEPLSMNVEDWRLVRGFINFIVEHKLDDCFTYTIRRCGADDDEIQSLSRPQAYHFYFNFEQQNSISLKDLTFMDDTITFKGKKRVTSIFKVLLFYLYIKENKEEEVLDFIKKYIDTYEKKELRHSDNYYSSEILKDVVLSYLFKQNEFFGSRFVFNEEDFYSFLPEEYNSKNVNFYELILYLYLNNVIVIDDCKFVNFNIATSAILIKIIVSVKNIEEIKKVLYIKTSENKESDSKEVMQNNKFNIKKWEKLSLVYINAREFYVKGYPDKTITYSEIGLENKTKKSFDNLKLAGVLLDTFRDSIDFRIDIDSFGSEITSTKKALKNLLCKYFEIEEDPFKYSSRDKTYEPRFIIEKHHNYEVNVKNETFNNGNDDELDIKEMMENPNY